MLSQLTIRNYAIVESLDLELLPGMTVVSGETGAGKSIMLDALGLALGDRAESGAVRTGAERAEIVATFDLAQLPDAAAWLREHDLDLDGDCLLRRVITAEGRSRSYINGQPCPVSAVRELADHLVDIHGQHEHQRLLKRDYHRSLLDEYAGQSEQAARLREHFNHWRRLDQELRTLTEQSEEQTARLQLLSYQTEELDQLGLTDGELEQLEEEQKTLANAGQILQTGHQLLELTADSEQENCLSLLAHCEQLLASIDSQSPALQQAADMLGSAQIQIAEASQEVRHFLDRVEINPGRQQEVEERLSSIYDIARKHRIQPEELTAFQQRLQQELDSLSRSDEELDALGAEVDAAYTAYLKSAKALSAARQKAARRLGKAVDGQLHELGMLAAHFEVSLVELPAERQALTDWKRWSS
ncbi:DNA repair protein RecN [Marinobacterium aestuariivivens]|uniref:DNA repair protein RecN n=1 Tax=Marinobacterium aestuariivivens TaxID=1698799 RepID=A0ABW1ZY93_9GAMM